MEGHEIARSSSNEGIEVKIGDWIQKGWEIFKDNMGLSILTVLLYLVIACVPMLVPYLGGLAAYVIYGPLGAGMYFFFFEIMRGKDAKVDSLFKGFHFFVPLMLVGLISNIFTGIAALFCLLPGLIVGTFYMFALPLCIEKKMAFWDAMELSRKTVMKSLLNFILFYFVCGIIMTAGMLACGVGLLFTVPIGMAAIAAAYKDVFGLET